MVAKIRAAGFCSQILQLKMDSKTSPWMPLFELSVE